MYNSITKKVMNTPEDYYHKNIEELETIINTNNKYQNLSKIFESFKQNKIYHLAFLLFSHYRNLILPYINIIPNESENIYTFNKIDQKKIFSLDENYFILWYYYLFCELYQKNSKNINQIRYLLSETNKIVSSLYKKGNLSINEIINILDIYLLSLKQKVQSSDFIYLPNDEQKIIKIIIFENFFNLLQKISIITVKKDKIKNFGLILEYLEKLNDNSELNDEIDINILLTNNIIQDFMNNLIQNINYVEIANIFPLYKEKLINFYSHFLAYKYKISNLFSNVMDILRHSFEHLYYFINNKDLILKDICLNNFNSFLIKKLFEIEQENNKDETVYPLESSFLFDQENSMISFTSQKMKLNNIILFFSFQIGNKNSIDKNNQELPLFLIKRKKSNKVNVLFLKVCLRKFKTKNEKEKAKYNLCLLYPSKDKKALMKKVIETGNFIIDDYNTYYCALFLNEKKIRIYLYYEILKKKNNVLFKEMDFNPMTKEEELLILIGNNEEFSFYKGKMGPIIIIKSPNKIKSLDRLISDILLLKDKYKDFLITKSEKKKKKYNFDLVEYYEQKSMNDIHENNEKEKIEYPKNFSCILYLDPNSFNYLKNDTINEDEKNQNKLPIFSEFSKNNKNFTINYINVSLCIYKNIKQLFVMDDGLNYICLQIEYFSQFLKYYVLKKKNKCIYCSNESDIITKNIIMSLKNYILLLGYYNHSKNLNNSYKRIYVNLYNCLICLNNIIPILDDFFTELFFLKDIYRGIIINSKQSFSEEVPNSNNIYLIYNDNKYNNKIYFDDNNDYYNFFLHENISYYIGIIEILLTYEFYRKMQNKKKIQFLNKILANLLSNYAIYEKNNNNIITNINITFYENIFYKLLNLISGIYNDFYQSYNINEKNDNNDKSDNIEGDEIIKILASIFKLLFNIINVKNYNNDDKSIKITNDYFRIIFRFVLNNNSKNHHVVYCYLNTIKTFMDGQYIQRFNENEINYLKSYLYELKNNNDDYIIKFDKRKIEFLLMDVVYKYITSIPNNINSTDIHFIEDYIKNSEITTELLLQIVAIFKNYFSSIFEIKKNNNPSVNNSESTKEIMGYFWNLFLFLIFVLKKIKSNENKDNSKDIEKNLYDILGVLFFIDSRIQDVMNFNKINKFIIIYIINYIKFIYYILNDEETIFLFKNKFFLQSIYDIFNFCYKSTFIHCNSYIFINEINIPEIKGTKKLISEIFFDIFSTRLEHIYLKYSKPESEEITDEELFFLDEFIKILDNQYIIKFIYSDYFLKKDENDIGFNDYKSIFFLSDFLKLLLSEKKFAKKFEKSTSINVRLSFYKQMKEITSNINENNNNDSNNIFDFYFTTYYFYQIFEFKNKIILYSKNKEIMKQNKLVNKLSNLISILFKINNIIYNDHLRLNLLYKGFYARKIRNNDIFLQRLLNIVVNQMFKNNKKSKNKDNSSAISISSSVKELEEELAKKPKIIERKSADLSSQIKNNINDINILDRRNTVYKTEDINKLINLKMKKEDNKNDKNKSDNNKKINNIEKKDKNSINENLIINNVDNNNEIKIEKQYIEKNVIKDIEISYFDLKNDIYSNIFLDEMDRSYILNPKKQLMKTIFGIYFEKSFFNNKTFIKLKNYFLNSYPKAEPNTKVLNFPTKIKNYTNGIEIPLFLKKFDKFFITKIFPITHTFFYNYMKEHCILDESIILLKNNFPNSLINHINYNRGEKGTNIQLNNIKKEDEFDCELIKNDRIYFGHMINYIEGGFLFFLEGEFKIDVKAKNIKEELEEKIFSLSALDIITTKNTKIVKEEAKNFFLDGEIFLNEDINYGKKVIIFYSDIEEIIERRILYIWQGIEIFLKNGKSYIFNFLKEENFKNIKKKLKKLNIFFREKDFILNTKISENWRKTKLNTYEYLLYLNKYGSRSFNDTSQYYIFPWLLNKITSIKEINNNEEEIYKYILENNKIEEKMSTNDGNKGIKGQKIKKSRDIKNNNGIQYFNDFRQLEYPITVQSAKSKATKLKKYNDEEEKFPHHHGSHYSTGSYIFYYLMRLEPFTSQLVELQNYTQENPDRMLNNLKETMKISNAGNDNRELIPELFSKIEPFVNVNCSFFGIKRNKKLVDDIETIFQDDNDKYKYKHLSSYVQFVIEHKKLLNSKEIAFNINSWIDNIFGIGQLPQNEKESFNIFIKTSYEKYTNLHSKLNKYFEKGLDLKKALYKFANKINLIISFGQTPQQIFNEKHQKRIINYEEKIVGLAEEDPNNYGNDEYIGNDFLDTFIETDLRSENNDIPIKKPGIFFEINYSLGKLFILCENCELLIIDTNFYNYSKSRNYSFKDLNEYPIPNIYCFNKFKIENNNNYYMPNIKYCLSSFPNDENKNKNININKNSNTNTIKEPIPYLYSNKYIKNISINDKDDNNEEAVEKFKFMTCRYLDNSFKIHLINNKKMQTCSYFCEDLVMCCKVISSNSFIIGLKNGRLIKALIIEKKDQDENKKKEKEKEFTSDTYTILYDKYIQGHKGYINMIEINETLGVLITGGDDNKLCIRKLYDFELLTVISINPKYIITMAKISPMHFLYILCYNKIKERFTIFGYTLSGLKFAKSEYSYYTNLDFTNNGNIITLINDNQIGILNAYNLKQLEINKEDKDYEKYEKTKEKMENKFKWVQYNDFKKYYNAERNIISCICLDPKSKSYYYKTIKVTNISYFQ